MLKTSRVSLLGLEYARGGLVTVQVTGDVAAVRTAVEAGAAAATRLGGLVSSHVIPRPAQELEAILPREAAPAAEKKPTPAEEELSFAPAPGAAEYRARLEAMNVHELRTLARNTAGLAIQGREISMANRDVLIRELLNVRAGG